MISFHYINFSGLAVLRKREAEERRLKPGWKEGFNSDWRCPCIWFLNLSLIPMLNIKNTGPFSDNQY